jgi:hypothetical protein
MFAEIVHLLSSPDQHVCVYRDGEIYIEPVTPPGWTPRAVTSPSNNPVALVAGEFGHQSFDGAAAEAMG